MVAALKWRAALLLAALAACRYGVNPNEGKFMCASDADCGSGWHCSMSCARPDFTPYCVANGTCDPCPSFETDPQNCGSCGVVCPSTDNCLNNTCVSVAADAG
jgi:hypothetical protein